MAEVGILPANADQAKRHALGAVTIPRIAAYAAHRWKLAVSGKEHRNLADPSGER